MHVLLKNINSSDLTHMLCRIFLSSVSNASSCIAVYAVMYEDVSGISGAVTLDARVSIATVVFNVVTVWRSLVALAGGGMTIAANITTTAGDMWLEGNADLMGTDSITISVANIHLSATGGSVGSKLTLQATQTGSILAVAPTTWSASNGLSLMAPATITSGTGNVVLHADSDANGSGLMTFGPSGSMLINVASGR